jgi:hypothetical protein
MRNPKTQFESRLGVLTLQMFLHSFQAVLEQLKILHDCFLPRHRTITAGTIFITQRYMASDLMNKYDE